MYTVTIKGFTSREELLKWIQSQEMIHAAEECPFHINEEVLLRERSAFNGNLNKKDFDIEIKYLNNNV